jgi:hypothetical protein
MGVPGYPEFISTKAPSDVPATEIAAATAAVPGWRGSPAT